MSSAQDGGGRDQVAEVDGDDVVLDIGCSEEWASMAIRTSQHVGPEDVTQVNVLLKEGDGVRAVTDAIASIERQLDGGEPIPILDHAPHQYRIGFSEERARQIVDDLKTSLEFGADAHSIELKLAPSTLNELVEQFRRQT